MVITNTMQHHYLGIIHTYCSISDDQQLHNKSKPVRNLLYDNACKYYQINHK